MLSKIFILLFCICNVCHSQVIKTNMGYLISHEDLSIIDREARKGVQCDTIVSQAEKLIEQITDAKIYSDSISVILDKKIFALTNQFNEDQRIKNACQVKNRDLTIELNLANKANKKLRTKNTITTILGTLATALTIYKFVK